jgi:hypothetical protein
MHWHCLHGQGPWSIGPWGLKPLRDRGGRLWLRLREVNQLIGNLEFRGFSYGYKFRSRRYRINCIHDRATWELNGRATGNSLYMRGHHESPRRTIRGKSEEFTTARPEQSKPPLQFLPLFSELQGFTFQFNRRGVLITAFEKPLPCLSLIQKDRRRNYIIHWHQLYHPDGKESLCLDFPALEVMWTDAKASGEVERIGHYEAVRNELYARYREVLGIQSAQALPAGELASPAGSRLLEVEQGIDKLAQAGCAEVLLPWALDEIAADPASETASAAALTDGLEAGRLKRVVEMAHKRGMQAGALLDTSAAPPGWRKALQAFLRRKKKEILLDSVYLAGNSTPGAHPTQRLSEEAETLSLCRALQSMGYRYGADGCGVLGISTQAEPYDLVRNNEFLYKNSVVPFPYKQVRATSDDPHAAYFRGYANRLCYSVRAGGTGEKKTTLEDWWDEDFAAINRAFCAVHEHMYCLRPLGGDRGVLWHDAAKQVGVLWAYREFLWRTGEQARVYNVTDRKAVRLQERGFAARPLCVYLVQGAAEP